MTTIEKLRRLGHTARWQTRWRILRYAMAWRYATGNITPEDAWTLWRECEDITGYHDLEGLSETSVLEQAIDRYGDRPELPELVNRACSRVASKWNSSGDTAAAAEDWAHDLIAEYATDAGIELTDAWAIENAPAESEGV